MVLGLVRAALPCIRTHHIHNLRRSADAHARSILVDVNSVGANGARKRMDLAQASQKKD